MDAVVHLGYFSIDDSSPICVKSMDLLFHLIWIDHVGLFQKLQHVLPFLQAALQITAGQWSMTVSK